MHIEKNVLEAILNTLLMNDKSKDTAKARQDLKRMMQRLLLYGLQKYLPDEVAKPIIELCSFCKQICSATLMEDDMLKAQSKRLLKVAYSPQWMFPFKRFMKKLKGYVRNKAKPEGSIAKGYVIEEALTFSSHYFRDVIMKFNRPYRNVDPHPPTKFPNKDMKEESPTGLGRSATSKLFALAYGPTPTPISVNSCVVNGVRFVVHSLDERHITQNNDIYSPGKKDEEMYYDSNDEDLVSVDDDDGVDVVFSNVARGHGGGDDHPPTHHISTGCEGCFVNRGKGTRKPNLGGRKTGMLHTIQETRNLKLKKITDDKGPRDAFVLPFFPAERKEAIVTKIGMESSSTREYPSLIYTFFVTHTVDGVFMLDEDRAIYALGSNTPSGVPYTEEEINALPRKGKQRGHLPGVSRVLPGYAINVLSLPPPQCTHNFADMLSQYESSPEFGNASGSGGCEVDEMADDEDDGEDKEDEEDDDN
uniref:DUF4218 domain-containing protein n=1 Tax=Tanacetum cinerariifolium TaxID=118510 RepID=A0A6L2J3X4_TANCI|nr:hypothetical protein [Tanacetum cinerariifolium]